MADIKICISLVAYSLICLCACVLCFFVFILYAYLFFSIEAPRNGCSHCIGPKKKQATLQMTDIRICISLVACSLICLFACLLGPRFPLPWLGTRPSMIFRWVWFQIQCGLISDSVFLVAAGAATLFIDATMFFSVFLTRFLFRIYKILGILQSQQAIIFIIFPTNF